MFQPVVAFDEPKLAFVFMLIFACMLVDIVEPEHQVEPVLELVVALN